MALAPLLPRLLLIACAISVAASLVLEGNLALPSGEALFAGIALGLGPYGVAMVAWDKALRWGMPAWSAAWHMAYRFLPLCCWYWQA
ncbi:hypothetical protein HSBAA_12790 [Vreelandella sulfidaeris]|uniref:EamA domain-containing protein n=1 Tax=Vreelandella sulfidaeris TaxID=115553 RepID=A0A455U455_9GAMM|nr:hypothetical protein HSBAA_12790 [Halomonas sulfidaeris]